MSYGFITYNDKGFENLRGKREGVTKFMSETITTSEKKKSILLLTIATIVSLIITLTAVYIYRNMNLPVIGNKIVQNVSYILMLLLSLILIKTSGKTYKEFGLFKKGFGKQVLIGAGIGVATFAFFFLTGWRPTTKEDMLYIVLSQMLVGFSEELLFRGVILTFMRDLVKSTNWAAFWAAFLFGVWHYPIGQSISQVTTTFFLGLVYGALRTTLDEDVSVVSLAIPHWMMNAFL